MQWVWENISNSIIGKLLQTRSMESALVLAVLAHGVLLMLPAFKNDSRISNSTVLNLTLQQEPEIQKVDSELKNNPIEESKIESKAEKKLTEVTPVKVDEQLQPKENTKEDTTLLQSPPLTNSKGEVPVSRILSYGNIKRFVKSEIQSSNGDSQVEVDEFSNTFLEPKKPEYKDIKREGTSLGGGNYKIRKNGVECESLKMVPQSYDEVHNYSSILTIGNCVDKNKKIRLLDENGKILNSDRYQE